MRTLTYTNSFYEGAGGANNPYASRTITGEFVETCGPFDIYTSKSGLQFDIVRDGVCVGMYAGLGGARRRCAQLAGPHEWILWAQYGEYWAWCWYDSTTKESTWQVTVDRNAPPSNYAGYGSLESLLKLKGLTP